MPSYISNRGYVNYDANTGAYTGGRVNVYDYEQTLGIKQIDILTPTSTTAGGRLDKRSQYLYVIKNQYLSNFNFAALVVAGGGGSGWDVGGAGGAGGFISLPIVSVPKTNYTITVGPGGLAGNGSVGHGQNGGNSVAFGYTAIGGGGGGLYPGIAGYDGGSGGGGGGVIGTAGPGGAGTPGQGFAGGASYTSTWGSGGGGGAGGVGGDGRFAGANFGGDGGPGLPSSITGTLTYYAGGGAGGGGNGISGGPGSAGIGGGGAGGNRSAAGANGTPGTGGGAGGSSVPGGAAFGGSGIVIVAYVGAQTASGGVVTSVSNSAGAFTVHSFLSNGTFSIPT